METEQSRSKAEENTSETSRKTFSLVMAISSGRMAESTKVADPKT
jgi:hypothetical protein